MLTKFSSDLVNDHIPHDYGNIWFEEETAGPNRLIVAPSSAHINLMLDLARHIHPPYHCLYVLLLSRGDRHDTGRYESPLIETYDELCDFCNRFKSYLESDGRHHFWIGAPDDNGLLVYDQHNVIYAYGPLQQFKEFLLSKGFKRQKVKFPAPHAHKYHVENDPTEEELIKYWKWRVFPLQEGDEWD